MGIPFYKLVWRQAISSYLSFSAVLLMVALAETHFLVAAAPDPPPPALLTNLAQIHNLSSNQAQQHLPVKVQAVVTYFFGQHGHLFAQDETAGIYVVGDPPLPRMEAGDWLELEGTTDPGLFAPVLFVQKRPQLLGKRPLPQPVREPMHLLVLGTRDGSVVEVPGIIRQARQEGTHLYLMLAASGYRVPVDVRLFPGETVPPQLLDAEVLVRGACATDYNSRRQITGIRLYASGITNNLVILRPGSDVVFERPARPIDSILTYVAPNAVEHRVKIAGVVTARLSDEAFFVQDASDGILVRPQNPVRIPLGLEVEVMGFPAMADISPELQDAVVRTNKSGTMPPAAALKMEDLFSGAHDGQLVRVEGELLGRFAGRELHFSVRSGERVLEAVLDKSDVAALEIRPHSLVAITGVCLMQGSDPKTPESVRLLMRTMADLQVLRAAPWWTAARIGAVLALACAGMLIVLAWVMLLRHRLAQQAALIQERLQREAALEEHFRQLVENSFDAVYTHDLEGNLRSANQAWERLTGYPREHGLTKNVLEFMPPQCREAAREDLKQFLATGVTSIREEEWLVKDAKQVWVERSARLARQDGRPIAVQCIARDVTDRHHAQQALRDSEERYRQFLQNFQGIAYQLEPQTSKPLLFHGQVALLTGYAPSEFLDGKVKWMNLIHPGDRQAMLEEGKRLTAEPDHVSRQEYRIICQDGLIKWVEDCARITCDQDGRPLCIQGTIHDVTKRRRAQEALAKSEANLRLAQEIGRVGSWEHDIPNAILEWSPETYRIFGCSPENFHPTIKAFFDMIVPEDRDKVRQASTRARDEGADYEVEHRIIRRSDGQRRVVIEQAKVIRNAQGQTIRMVGTLRDITESKQAEETRIKLEAQLRQAQKMEAIGQLAAGVAHDFNNILTVIQGNIGLIEDEVGDRPEAAGWARQLAEAATRAASLTRQLLLTTRKQLAQRQQVGLNELIRNLTRMLSRLIGEHIKLQQQLGENLPPINADPGMIEQVIMNLAVNARDAMPQGGELILATSTVILESPAAPDHPQRRAGEFLRLRVSDTGCGMSKEILAHIYEPFFTTKDVGKGTGLGLATVYGIVQQHQGWIEVESEPGKGTTFTIYLPPATGPAAGAEATLLRAMTSGGEESILVVEDEDSVRALLRNVLRRQGYKVITAESGSKALALVAEQKDLKFELLLTDIVMPDGVSGLQLAQRLRVQHPELKVVLTSGYNPDQQQINQMQDVNTRFLAKPYELAVLLRIVRSCLDGKE